MTNNVMISKTSIIIFLFLYISTTTTTAYENVLDSEGNPVLPKTPYYVLPMNTSQGGGVTLLSKSSESPCPFHVALDPSTGSRGTAVKFLYYRSEAIKTTYIDVDLNVVFDFGGTKCSEPKGWRLSTKGGSSSSYVRTGGQVGLIFEELDWFKVKKVVEEDGKKNVYKFVWCPEFMEGSSKICLNLGVVSEGGVGYLAVKDTPLLVQFKRA
ncbi:hypothetical protein vseg_002010 [Gypsophila vaccaria]